MSNPLPKTRPSHRVSFARIVGQDDKGNDRLGMTRQIGSVWPRKTGDGSIIRLDFVPIELTQHQGVLFLTEIAGKSGEEEGFAS